jgi:ribonucleotide reductase alpha subunit
MTIATPWSSVGYLTYKRTYSRRLDEQNINSDTEEFADTIKRVVDATETQLKCGFDEEEKERLTAYLLGLKGSVAGRFLWQLGTDTVGKLGLASLQNCAFTVIDKPVLPFTWAMDMLMLGSGVGYNIQKEHVDKLPKVRKNFKAPQRLDKADANFIVPDSREGWVALLGKTLKAAFLAHETGQQTFTYSTQLIRGKGAPIKGFGGTASGPEDLCWGIQKISEVIEKRAGKKMRPIDCLDVMNIIGAVVVAGNVRRSAQIAIGDPDDVEYLLSKRWDMGTIPSWRAMSNNSVVCSDISELHDYFWEGYEGKGEPFGLINLELSRLVGRLGDTAYPDPDVMGYNPCAEQSLASFETCCLAEVFLPNVDSYNEFVDICKLLYRVNKHSLALECHQKDTEAIVHKNMRMGIGVTGVLQATKEQRGWLEKAYIDLRRFDSLYSFQKGFPVSIKLTTCKPSGTLSLLPGVTPGIHPGYAQYMIRRIRISADHSLVNVCREHGYDVEFQRNFDGSEDHSTVVVSFPFSYPEGTKLAADMTAIDQLKEVKKLQKEWSDNSVSCTVYYRKEELPEIKKYLAKNYKDNHKSLSFLLHSEHGFAQAPYEEITKELFDEMVAKTTLISAVRGSMDFDGGDDCLLGSCPIK